MGWVIFLANGVIFLGNEVIFLGNGVTFLGNGNLMIFLGIENLTVEPNVSARGGSLIFQWPPYGFHKSDKPNTTCEPFILFIHLSLIYYRVQFADYISLQSNIFQDL